MRNESKSIMIFKRRQFSTPSHIFWVFWYYGIALNFQLSVRNATFFIWFNSIWSFEEYIQIKDCIQKRNPLRLQNECLIANWAKLWKWFKTTKIRKIIIKAKVHSCRQKESRGYSHHAAAIKLITNMIHWNLACSHPPMNPIKLKCQTPNKKDKLDFSYILCYWLQLL